jgi:hypothetical protein
LIFHLLIIDIISRSDSPHSIPGLEVTIALEQTDAMYVSIYSDPDIHKIGDFYYREREAYPTLVLSGHIEATSSAASSTVDCNLLKSFASDFLRIEATEGITAEVLDVYGEFTDVNIAFEDFPVDKEFEIRVVYPMSNISDQPYGAFDIYDRGWDFSEYVLTDQNDQGNSEEKKYIDELRQIADDAVNMGELMSYISGLEYIARDADDSDGASIGRNITQILEEQKANCLDAGIVAAALLDIKYGIQAIPIVTDTLYGDTSKSHLELQIPTGTGQWITFDPRLSTDGVLRANFSAPLPTMTPIDHWKAYLGNGTIKPSSDNALVQVCIMGWTVEARDTVSGPTIEFPDVYSLPNVLEGAA